MNYRRINQVTGWVVFLAALGVYWATMEETGSFWDCGEFIAASYKLQVPHPPGAPLFLLLGRMFSLLALGDTSQVAYWVNFMSVCMGAFTVLFIFWSVTLLGKKLMCAGDKSLSRIDVLVLMGAGITGSFACAFADAIWFSAVEAEVYASSTCFTAFVVWATLKWETIEEPGRANRWLILIFFMIGLSIGVHLLNLLTLPALALVYYYKKYKPTGRGVVVALGAGIGMIFVINTLIITGLPALAEALELFFVNTLRLPFGSGIVFVSVSVIVALAWAIHYSIVRRKVTLNTALLSLAFVLIGYASYGIIVIRSNFDTPINENAPSDLITFVRYLERKQYESWPLAHGPYFNAKRTGYHVDEVIYQRSKDRYVEKEKRYSLEYDPGDMTIFPRIYRTDEDSQQRYRRLLGLRANQRPDFIDNLRFFFSYQVGWMYARYFMFNFAGRESDMQNGGWMSPAGWFENVPSVLSANKARNNFFMIPLLLGIVGLIYQSVKDKRRFYVVGLLFVLMGFAIVVYLNSPPFEPRERDYIYAGSFYAFCMWIGLSVIALRRFLVPVTGSVRVAAAVAIAAGLAAPALMASEGWDDHDRSGRFFSADIAYNYLNSCAPNAVLFTRGDNDTFPLWYLQETEGIRTDVRVVVGTYYDTDWYIEQTMRKAYDSDPLPYSLSASQYRDGGPNDVLYYNDFGMESVDVKQYISLLGKDYKGLRIYPESKNAVPAKVLTLNVDVEQVRAMGIVPKRYEPSIVPKMKLRMTGPYLEKKDLALLDILSTNDWKRPLYVDIGAEFNIDLSPYLVQEGLAYRILPIENPDPEVPLVNTARTYENIVTKYRYRNLDDPDVNYNEDYRGFVLNHRSCFNDLAAALLAEGNDEQAREVLLDSLKKMPDRTVPYDYASARSVTLLLAAGEHQKAVEMAEVMGTRAEEWGDYYLKHSDFGRGLQIQIYILGELQHTMRVYGEGALAAKLEKAFEKFRSLFR